MTTEFKVGTVGWLMEQLKKHDPDMYVLSTDWDGWCYDIDSTCVEFVAAGRVVDEGEEGAGKVVCLR